MVNARFAVIASIVAVVVAACGGPKPSPTPPETPPAKSVEEAAKPPHSAAPLAVDATPDTPSATNTARDAELAKLVTPIVDAYTNFEPTLTRDGKRLVFASTRDGLPQLYIADARKPDAPATRLVTSSERHATVQMLPDGKSLVFRSDHGADENWSFYRVNLDGSGLVELTPGARWSRNPQIVVDGKPDTLFYSARAMSDVATSVYSTSAKAPGEEKLLFRDDKPGGLFDVSRDGKWGLYNKVPSHSQNYALAIDLATGKSRQLYPKDGAGTKVTISGLAFSADGKRALIATDGGGDQSLLLSIDVATGKELARYVETKPTTAEITALAVAKRGNTLAALVDAGNHRELRLLDAITLKPKAAVSLPLGSGNAGSFSEDGKRFTLSWSTPNAPNDVFAVEVATGKVSALRKDRRPQLDGLAPIEASIIEVEAFDHLKIPVNVFLPSGAKGKKLPVIVSYHGGPASSSAIRWAPAVRFFLGLGYAWVEPNVRGSSGFGRAYEEGDNGPRRLDAFKDIETTGRWAASQPWADKDRVVGSERFTGSLLANA